MSSALQFRIGFVVDLVACCAFSFDGLGFVRVAEAGQ